MTIARAQGERPTPTRPTSGANESPALARGAALLKSLSPFCARRASRISVSRTSSFVGAGGVEVAVLRAARVKNTFIGLTTRKKMTAAMIRNEMTLLMKSPIRKALPLMVNWTAEKSGWPPIAAMSGVIKSLTRASTIALNAAPITTATARSTTFPRKIKSRNSLSIPCPPRHWRPHSPQDDLTPS